MTRPLGSESIIDLPGLMDPDSEDEMHTLGPLAPSQHDAEVILPLTGFEFTQAGGIDGNLEPRHELGERGIARGGLDDLGSQSPTSPVFFGDSSWRASLALSAFGPLLRPPSASAFSHLALCSLNADMIRSLSCLEYPSGSLDISTARESRLASARA